MPNPATTHAAHDELLIARLFGDDVDERERAAAIEQMAACDECADLFADLGSIREATAALPVPARPRDFSLTPADAARLRPARHGLGRILGLGPRRSFGGALAALGISGLLLTTAVSAIPGMSHTTSAALDTGSKAAPEAAGSANDFANGAASPALVPNTGDTTAGGQPAAATAAATAASAVNLTPAETPRAAGASQGSQVAPVPATPAPSAGDQAADYVAGPWFPDWRVLLVACSMLLLALGLLLLIVPALLRRRSRG